MPIRVFISYSWDDLAHQEWVVNLANRLRESGIDANVDVFNAHKETTNLNKMMVKEISISDNVIVVLTEQYKQKATSWEGGVGFESELLLSVLTDQEVKDKIIFIMKNPSGYSEAFPPQYKNYYAIDFSDESKFNHKFKELLHRIYGEPLYRKSDIGIKPVLEPLNPSIEKIDNNDDVILLKSIDEGYIVIDNVISLLENIGSDKKIFLKQGVYNISKGLAINNDYISWKEEYDGKYPILRNIKNLSINAELGTYILIEPRYAFVFEFLGCENINLSNLTLGHTESGYCVGGVLRFDTTTDIELSDCVLFGCGTIGIDLNNVERFNMTKSVIKECTYSIMHIRHSNSIKFTESTFKDTQEFDLIEIENSNSIEICNSIISSNATGEFLPHLFRVIGNCHNLKVIGTEIKNNETKYLINDRTLIEFIDCKFKNNEFRDFPLESALNILGEKPSLPINENVIDDYEHLLVNANYSSIDSRGNVVFDYSNNNGHYFIGKDEFLFELCFLKSSDNDIQLLNDPKSIHSVSIAKGINDINEIDDARIYDGSSRIRRPKTGGIAILKNVNGYYAAIKIVSIKDDTRGADFDEVTFDYVIQTNRSPDFTSH
ncbi:TIR domain-containing protein [Citrobacter koseri]|uniref:TIR domain-containing protein n=1 Tax=Citrobacter koseri TaxID=545 RepID=UPI003891D5C7